MKQIFTYFITLSCLVLAISCEKPENNDAERKPGSALLKNIQIEACCVSATATTASIEYGIDLGEAADMPLQAWLKYSVSSKFPSSSTDEVQLDMKKGEVTVSNLLFDTEYFFEVYLVLYESEYSLPDWAGKLKTKAVSISMGDAVESDSGLLLSGKVNGIGEADLTTLKYTLHLDDPNSAVTEYPVELNEDFTFSHTVENLDIGTDYSYWLKVYQHNKVADSDIKSEKKTYTTCDPYLAAEKDVTGDPTDLSGNGAANCYIVSDSGSYKFRLVKGNSQELLSGVKSVRVLWESNGTVFKVAPLTLICATAMDGEYALFEVPQPFTEGNAVIAAYNEVGEILWSWHIWLTKATMKEITYNYKDGGEFKVAGVMMDRNLGALSAEVNEPKSLGLLYQWGRKDPFTGSAYTQGTIRAASTRLSKDVPNTEVTSTLEYAIANPHRFILKNATGEWLSVAEGSGRDNSLWSATKTVYDPCPAGWRVPDGGYDGGHESDGLPNGIWAKAGIPAKAYVYLDDSEVGMRGKMFGEPYCSPETWYPAAGSLAAGADGFGLYDVGVDGLYASVTAFSSGQYVTGLAFNYYPNERRHYICCGGELFERAGGYSVRCCKE